MRIPARSTDENRQPSRSHFSLLVFFYCLIVLGTLFISLILHICLHSATVRDVFKYFTVRNIFLLILYILLALENVLETKRRKSFIVRSKCILLQKNLAHAQL